MRRVGINFGAPGVRRSGDGLLWLPYPRIRGVSLPSILVSVEMDRSMLWRRAAAQQCPGGDVSKSGLDFGGEGDYVETKQPVDISGGGALVAWGWTDDGSFILGSHGGSSGGNERLYISSRYGWGVGDSYYGRVSFPIGKWFPVILNFDDGEVELYVDQKLVAEGTYDFEGDKVAPPLYFGARNRRNGAADSMVGKMRDVALYDRPLNEKEREMLYSNSYLKDGLVHHWRFNEGSKYLPVISGIEIMAQ